MMMMMMMMMIGMLGKAIGQEDGIKEQSRKENVGPLMTETAPVSQLKTCAISTAPNLDDDCSVYWPYFSRGGYACTRENNPVRDASGKQHSNKCMMCLQRFKNGGKMNSLEKRQPQNGNNGRGNDVCYEYRSQMGPDGELSCTRENDPVRDASGHTHSNKCIMCAEKL
ncbi:hypothetical protein JD844_012369 [Phrynosoma platyrhinos]|uniref:Kazal-like domain-containing protein n=1 Tax=Phrynosoma platyrhinos TaxID=52577 RepID=A0ABQ7TJQ4_PHRPL|nr:hypothetical protein JD844_012369 [Phrynosoma platyrhinos]